MALFGNQNKKSIDELESYYSGKQQRSGMAWVMPFLSLLLTITVLGSLFFGGRWVYRSLTDDDTTEVVTTTTANTDTSSNDIVVSPSDPNTDSQPQVGSGVITDEAASTDTPNVDVAAPNPSSTEDVDNEQDEATDTTAAATTETPSTPATTSLTVTIPNTGTNPATIVITAALVTASGYIVSIRRRLQR